MLMKQQLKYNYKLNTIQICVYEISFKLNVKYVLNVIICIKLHIFYMQISTYIKM